MSQKFKKTTKAVLAAALASSALIPVASVSANTTTIETIIVEQNGVQYEFARSFFNDAVGAKLLTASSISYYKLDGKYYSKNLFNDTLGTGKTVAETIAALTSSNKGVSLTTTPGKFENGKLVGGTPVVTGELKVESVSAINASQLVVTFNKPVDKATVVDTKSTADTKDDTLKAGAIVFTVLDGQTAATAPIADNAHASLSADGKTLTLTVAAGTYFNGNYSVVSTTGIKDTNGIELKRTATNISVNDTVRPVVTGVSYTDINTAWVSFNEPIATTGTVTYKLADGSAPAVAPTTIVADGKLKVNLTAVTDTNKDITVTVVGAADAKGNVIATNPYTFTVKKDTGDTTKPTVASVTVTGSTTFDIKFSEALSVAPTVANIGAATVAVVKDVTDPTVYHATISASVGGLQSVAISAFADLAGLTGDAVTKAVNFSADTTAPTLSSSKVESIDGIEYLVLSYDENVTPQDALSITGTYLKNYVTTAATTLVTETATTPTDNAPISLYKPTDGKSKSVKIVLTALTEPIEYTVVLPKGLVKDLYGNDSAKVNAHKFTRTTNNSINSPKLDSTYGGGNGILANATSNNVITVQFDRPVDGASALDKSNYSVEGATIKDVKLNANSTKGLVEITFENDSIALTGTRAITVKGVKSQAGQVFETVVTSELLNENVRPTVTKAELNSATKITLTFSENVINASATDDFDVYVGGVKYTGTVTTEAVTATLAAAKKTIEITLGTALTTEQVAAGLVVKPSATININDTALADATPVLTTGNALNFTQITVQ